MCCFTDFVDTVGDTCIFCRSAGDSRQYLVYSMAYAAASEVAMVLPLPVPPGSGEDAVTFINLEAYPEFFDDLEACFRPPFVPLPDDDDVGSLAMDDLPRKRLVVHDVGGFEASFVPSPGDFARLEPRFRIPPEAWKGLPQYADYGFAVFKLKPASAARRVHPMALSFPRRDPSAVFFPTLHVHDRELHGAAHFDHSLYVQWPGGNLASPRSQLARCPVPSWDQSYSRRASERVDMTRSQGVVDPDARCYRLRVEGRFQNQDIAFGTVASFPQSIPGLGERRSDDMGASETMEDWRTTALAEGARWLALGVDLKRACREEADVVRVLEERPDAYIFSTALSTGEQGTGLTRFHWQAGDRE